MLDRLVPLAFVGIWATGFIVARTVAPYADPLTFLTARFGFSALVFAVIAVAGRAAWPRAPSAWGNALIGGVLMQALYVGGVFWAVRHGLQAGLAALVGGLQPLMTAALSAPLLGETVSARRWFGIAVGFTGAVMVLGPGLAAAGGIPIVPLAICFVSIVSFTFGTILQKRTARGIDLRVNATLQFLAATLVVAPAAALMEPGRFDSNIPVWAGLLWAVFGLSVGAVSVLLWLIRRGAVAGVASLFYLVPPVTALIAFFAFGDLLAPVQMVGMVVAATGVAIANRP